jgi:rubredoxin
VEEMKKFRCTVCNFIYEGEDAPDKCPRCGSPKEKYEQIPEEKVKLIERSRLSNGLHMHLATLLEEVTQVATKGINDNLDPACVAIFTKAKDEAHLLRQFIKAEIQVHIGKGKWG